MSANSQKSENLRPTGRVRDWLRGALRAGRLMACGAVWLAAGESRGQFLRLGPFYFDAVGTASVSYDSNVDDAAEREVKEDYDRADFYWMPGISINSKPVPMRPGTMITLSANAAYMDYFTRNDLDTATYDTALRFNTSHPRISLSGQAGMTYSFESSEDEYVPGGAKRDPMLTHLADMAALWNYRKVRMEAGASFTRERHDYEEYWEGDQDETIWNFGAYLDKLARLSLYWTVTKTDTTYPQTLDWTEETVYSAGADYAVFSWGSLFCTWERTETVNAPFGEETIDIETTFGLSGSIPVDLIRRPKISYSLGFQYEEKDTGDGEPEKTWEPVHTINVSDEMQLTKTVLLSADATWSSEVDEDEVNFVYNISLTQQVGPRADHALTFTQEPRPTFGSTSDTETTTYGYSLSVRDLVFYGLSFSFSATYEEDTPLGEENAQTEKTTTITAGLSHSRQLSRKLSRSLSYDYSWEDSNFSDEGATIKHLVTYGLSYAF